MKIFELLRNKTIFFFKKFNSYLLNRFYFSLIFYFFFLLFSKFLVQDIKNRTRRLEIESQKIQIALSLKEAEKSELIIQYINSNKGKPIDPSQIINRKKL